MKKRERDGEGEERDQRVSSSYCPDQTTRQIARRVCVQNDSEFGTLEIDFRTVAFRIYCDIHTQSSRLLPSLVNPFANSSLTRSHRHSVTLPRNKRKREIERGGGGAKNHCKNMLRISV